MRLAICYVSNCNSELKPIQIQELLSQTQAHNNQQKIKGLLLFSDGNFFQIIEGTPETIYLLWEKIQEDPRHHSIIKIFEEKVSTQPFDGYLCDFISEEDETLQNGGLKNIFDQLKSLDEKPRNAAEEVLKLFLKCQ